VAVQAVALVLREHGDAPHASVHQIAEREIDQAIVGTEWHGGLAAIARERLEAFPLAAGEDDSENMGALEHRPGWCVDGRE
jgi:hypothetical protein